ncbi:hypothetical protein Tco_0167783 [Tanacetum coccineum]
MEILSLSRDVRMITMKMKNPLLDQTGGRREEEQAKNQSQPVLQKKGPPRQLKSPQLRVKTGDTEDTTSESARDVYFRRRIIAVTKLQIVEWHGYKHLDWITVRRDDDKLYTFKE